MADSSNSYRLALEVVLNPKSIDSQIRKIETDNKTVFRLKVELDFSEIKNQINSFKSQLGELQKSATNTTTSGSAKGAVLFDQAKNQQILDGIKQKIDAIKAAAKTVEKETFTTTDIGKGETLNKSVISYTDQLGKARVSTLQWKTDINGVAQAVKETNNYVNNIGTAEKKAAAEAKKITDEYKALQLQADKFLKKTEKSDKGDANVSQGIALAQQMKSVDGGTPLQPITPESLATLRQAGRELQVVNSAIQAGGKNTQGWTQEIGIAIKRTIEWAMSVGLVYGALNELKTGIQYITDLNKELTNIAVVTGMNKSEVDSLGSTYNKLAQDMKVTTLAVSSASLEYYRQGKTIAETQELVKSSLMMSQLGNIESGQATEYMTSVLNGFRKDASESVDVVDKLVAVDNAAATSVSELATALARSSSSAQLAGVSYEQLVSYVGTISSVTRKSAESIGESFLNFWRRCGITNKPQSKIPFNDLQFYCNA